MTSSEGFYDAQPEALLRLGDVIVGLSATEHKVKALGGTGREKGFEIVVHDPRFCVVMSPCCNIEDQVICLSPLLQVHEMFYKNPYFEEELTRINSPVPPESTLPPGRWSALSDEDRTKRLADGRTYTFRQVFIYAPSELLPSYGMTTPSNGIIQCGHYMVDYQNTFKVKCPQIQRGQRLPTGLKLLQLSCLTRRDLREKLAYYYYRPAEEDRAVLGREPLGEHWVFASSR